MAEGKGIRRLVQLILDKASADRLRKDAAEAINKGTDPAKAKKNLSAVDAAFAKIRKAALSLGGVLATVFAVRKIINFGKAAVAAATEAEAIWNRLGQAVENAGESFQAIRPEVEKTARAMQDVTTVGDEDFASVLTELITVSNDYQRSLQNVSVVADLAAAKQIDLRTAAQLVGRAMVGETGTLSRYGIVVQEGADAVEVLRERFRGFAENEAKSFQGRLKQLSNEWGDFKQAVGDALIAAGGGTSVLETLTATVKTMTEWVNENQVTFQRWGTNFLSLLERIGGAIQRKLDQLDPLGKRERDHMKEILDLSEDQLALDGKRFQLGQQIIALEQKRQEEVAETARLQALVDAGKTTPRLVTQSQIRAEKYEAEIRSLQALIRSIDELGAKTGATPPQISSGSFTPPAGADPPDLGDLTFSGPVPPLGRLEDAKDLQAIWQQYPGLMANVNAELSRAEKIKAGWAGLNSEMEMSAENAAKLEAQVGSLGSTSNEQLMLLQNAMASAAYGITNAFAVGFETIFSGMGGLAEAAQGIGLGIVGGLAEGMAQYHTAMGVGKIAESGWPPNPAALRSGLKHLVAAGLFKALDAMTARAATSPGSSGARASGGASNALRSGFQGESVGPEVHIYFDGPGFDAVNPRVQRIVYNAQQYAQDRFGENATVKTHRRSRG